MIGGGESEKWGWDGLFNYNQVLFPVVCSQKETANLQQACTIGHLEQSCRNLQSYCFYLCFSSHNSNPKAMVFAVYAHTFTWSNQGLILMELLLHGNSKFNSIAKWWLVADIWSWKMLPLLYKCCVIYATRARGCTWFLWSIKLYIIVTVFSRKLQ